MKKSPILTILALTFIVLFSACKQRSGPYSGSDTTPGFNPLITAFTSGIISSESFVKIRFSEPFADSVLPNTTLEPGIMLVSPSVEGNVYYVDQQSIEFRPDARFEQGKAYDVTLKTHKLFPAAEKGSVFEFRFHTIEQHLTVEVEGFSPYSDYKPELNKLNGILKTADGTTPEAIEAVLEVKQGKRNLPLRWDHGSQGKIHEFTIDSIQRAEKELLVEIHYDGASIQSDQKGVEEFLVPALGDFKVVGHKLIQYPEQHVVLSFSDPLRKNQYLDGLIRLSNDTDMRYIIEGSSIKAYPNVRQNGTLTLYIEPGIRNTAGKGLKAGVSYGIVFEEIKPAVQLLGNGVIIPSADEVILPFKAVNLKAIDVKVIQIYENNIAQFLQVNQLNGERELKRAGRLVKMKTIDLIADKPINYGQWNTFSLNLTDLVNTDPGSIYRIELNFRKSHSLFSCANSGEEEELQTDEEKYDQIQEEEMSYWDSYEGYYSTWDYYSYDGYQWEDREDPCTPAYYGKRRAVSRNILASNLGLIAKSGSSGTLHITVSDLLNAKGVSNAKVSVYNYQQQILAEGNTNAEGMLQLDPDSQPFLVVAEHGGQKGYLRLVDGAALSYSMFDVSGTVVQKGIKGFLYGERGVWRPGDSIYLNLILDDRSNPLPKGHPITFELKDPQGKVVQKRVLAGNASGFYPFHTETSSDAPTGRYTVSASVGGVRFVKMIRVETIKPNRLKIDLDFEKDTIFPARGPVSAALFGKWLTGATARNLRAEIEVVFRQMNTSFKGFEAYTFVNPGKSVGSYASSFWRGTVDESGSAEFSKQLNISGEAPGMLNAIFTTRLFEKSGDFSIDQKTVACSPYNTYVGIKTPPGDKRNMLLTDTTHRVDVITLSASGTPLTKLGLDVKVYKLSWRWWWDASSENLASYMGSSYQTPVYSTTISTKNGRGSFNFKIDYPEWGRYLLMVTDKGGHSAAKIVYMDWPGWAGKSRKGDPDAASVLSFSADKSTYTVGETATITIPSAEKGRLMISLENGSGVLKQEWIETEENETRYTLNVTAEMTPNIYVYASLIQPHGNTANDLPIRMFGVIPISVEDPETRLYPELKMPDELSPKQKVKITVSEKYNKEMTYTIAMVDEGLLDLTRFKTPDPWSSFFAKEALGVKTWDMFEHVLGAFGGRIDGIYSIGGGEDESGEGAKDANRFPPMVKFLGPFTLKGKSNMHEITMPNYIGSVRTMLIAGNDGAYGNADKTTAVKQPLMLLATLPRVLGPGEEVALPVNVFVMDDKIRDVELEITTNDMVRAEKTKKKVSFSGTGDEIVDFMLKIPEKTGVALVKITARSGKHKAEYDIELNVRSSNPPVTNYTTTALEASGTYTTEIDLVGMQGTNELLLEVSNIPPVDFGRRLKYLLRYPHGCIEQTTSAAFPQLFLGDVMDLDENVKKRSELNVKRAIERLSSFQLSSGGFSYWPGSIKESSWGTSYAGHFLLEAKDKGYQVPDRLIKSWQTYQKKSARKWSIAGSSNRFEIKQEQILQSYRLFTLALSGNAEMGSMNRLRERTDLVPEAKWRLSAAYALAGQKETARELITNVPTEVREYQDSRYSFGSSTRDKAMILEAMILIGMKENGVLLLENIASQLSAQRWMSTQTTAYSLIAVAKFTGGRTSDDRMSFEYSMNGAAMSKAETGMPLAQIEFDPGMDTKARLNFKNNSKGILFVRIINTGLPRPGQEQAKNQNLNVRVRYTDLDGRILDPSQILQGMDFKAEYNVYNPGNMGRLENVALTTIFPSGWEIHNERMFATNTLNESFTYQDVRDDRVMTYFSLNGNESKSFSIRLNAAYKGRYYLPSILAEEMYMNDIQVVIPGQWVEVEERN